MGYERSSISATGIFNSLPIIIFSFMYQINVPALYTELKDKNMKSITNVLVLGTSLACFCYIIAGIFGFVSFAATEPLEEYTRIFEQQQILLAPYNAYPGSKTPVIIYISIFALLLVVIFATPFCVLPTKDSLEDVFGIKADGRKLSKC